MSARWETSRFVSADVEAVVALWHRVFPNYYLFAAALRTFTSDHPDFDPNGGWVARDDDGIVGFVLGSDMAITEGPLSQMPGTIPRHTMR